METLSDQEINNADGSAETIVWYYAEQPQVVCSSLVYIIDLALSFRSIFVRDM